MNGQNEIPKASKVIAYGCLTIWFLLALVIGFPLVLTALMR